MGITERKEREKIRRRNEIVKAAENLFFKKGFESVTMDDIAEEAELSKGTLYLYFTSKEDLKFAIFRKGMEILSGNMREGLEKLKNGLEKLLHLGQQFIKFSKAHKNYFSLMMFFESIDFKAVNIDKDILKKYLTEESPIALVYDCVREGVEDKSIQVDIEPKILATTLWSQLMGILIVSKSKKEVYELFGINTDDILETHFKLILNKGLSG